MRTDSARLTPRVDARPGSPTGSAPGSIRKSRDMTPHVSELHQSGPPVEATDVDVAPPRATEVVIIGGGIVGVSTALALARRGGPVALCEKGVLAGEQSSRNWGWVRNMGRDPRELPLMIESMRIWADVEERLGGTGFRR